VVISILGVIDLKISHSWIIQILRVRKFGVLWAMGIDIKDWVLSDIGDLVEVIGVCDSFVTVYNGVNEYNLCLNEIMEVFDGN